MLGEFSIKNGYNNFTHINNSNFPYPKWDSYLEKSIL